MIPQEKSAAVTGGLRGAFGVTEFEAIRTIANGHTSSLVFRIVVRRISIPIEDHHPTDDPTRHYTCMDCVLVFPCRPRQESEERGWV